MGFSLPATGLVRSGVERATLVRRTYSLVLVSLVVTMVGTWFSLTNEAMLQAVAAHPFITMICAFLPLLAAQRARIAPPQRLGLVLVFTFIMGIAISPAIWFYGQRSPGVVSQAALLTLSSFSVLTIYAWTSRRDFSAWGGFLTVGVFVLLGTMLLNFFFQSQAASLWIAGVGVMLFSGLLVFDTWRLRNVYGPDDYVMAAVNIYLDLLNMFMFILQLLGGGRRN